MTTTWLKRLVTSGGSAASPGSAPSRRAPAAMEVMEGRVLCSATMLAADSAGDPDASPQTQLAADVGQTSASSYYNTWRTNFGRTA